jgi:hypothetical protein
MTDTVLEVEVEKQLQHIQISKVRIQETAREKRSRRLKEMWQPQAVYQVGQQLEGCIAGCKVMTTGATGLGLFTPILPAPGHVPSTT